jgi:hypothetical protein
MADTMQNVKSLGKEHQKIRGEKPTNKAGECCNRAVDPRVASLPDPISTCRSPEAE